MPTSVHVTAPSRLHFGLWSLGSAGARQFGGVGAMIDGPQLQLAVTEAESFQVSGSGRERTAEYARRWARFHGQDRPQCHLKIEAVIPGTCGPGQRDAIGAGGGRRTQCFCGICRASRRRNWR